MLIAANLLIAAALLAGGIWMTDSFYMSFADTGTMHTVLRAVVVVGLMIILFSRPPRSAPVRMVLGALSSVILIGACASMIDYHVGPLDAVLYLQVSIILALEAIESQTAPIAFESARSSAN